jgi:hypothetical protein
MNKGSHPYLVEGFQELGGGGLLAILVEDLAEPGENLGLPYAGHLAGTPSKISTQTQKTRAQNSMRIYIIGRKTKESIREAMEAYMQLAC